jgi:hypothetical protein
VQKVLGVKMQTPNMAVLGETGRYPLTLICKERVIKYWLKILSNPNSIMYDIFQSQYNSIDNQRCNFWANKVKTIIDELGYSYLWNNITPLTFNYFPQLKTRLREKFYQQ